MRDSSSAGTASKKWVTPTPIRQIMLKHTRGRGGTRVVPSKRQKGEDSLQKALAEAFQHYLTGSE
jgi:hypothetical protein